MNNTAKTRIRVATYARVSTQEQALEGTSMEFQRSHSLPTANCKTG
ncbi:MAG TPA: hypothetical protein G4O07_01645 [Dehalococcoidia bacterium]|nr:hypothetical protein [Dehalococcoidia bacterium]